MAIESPKYQAIDKEGHFELRLYESYVVAETVVQGKFEDVSNIGFRRLAGFIFGGNTSKESIKMTAPVGIEKKSEKIAMTSPVGLEKRDESYVVTFSMPSSYTLDTLPVPNDKTILIKVVPEKKVAAIKFSGTWSKERYHAHLRKLNSWMASRNLSKEGEPVFARYNPPWTPWFLRKNEILISIT